MPEVSTSWAIQDEDDSIRSFLIENTIYGMAGESVTLLLSGQRLGLISVVN